MTVATILDDKGRGVVTARPDDTLLSVCQLLSKRRIGAVVVSSDGERVDGIISERDVVAAVAEGGAGCLERPVGNYMTRRVSTCTPDDTVDTLMRVMTTGKFRHVPVMEDGRLVGIVSIGDAVKWRIAEAEAEARAMKEYIGVA